MCSLSIGRLLVLALGLRALKNLNGLPNLARAGAQVQQPQRCGGVPRRQRLFHRPFDSVQQKFRAPEQLGEYVWRWDLRTKAVSIVAAGFIIVRFFSPFSVSKCMPACQILTSQAGRPMPVRCWCCQLHCCLSWYLPSLPASMHAMILLSRHGFAMQ